MKKLLFIILLLPFFCISQENLSNEYVFTSLDEAMRQPDDVKVLQLKRKRLNGIPPEVYTFKNLKYLDLSSNRIKIIPERLSRLTQLEVLILSNNRIDNIPESIGDMKNLIKLDLSRNNLFELPRTIGDLIYLKELILWTNNIYSLPYEISRLDGRLEFLDMRSILINKEEQEAIRKLLPNVTIKFDRPCNCY